MTIRLKECKSTDPAALNLSSGYSAKLQVYHIDTDPDMNGDWHWVWSDIEIVEEYEPDSGKN